MVESTPRNAIANYTPSDACNTHYSDRTFNIYINNLTPASIEIAFFQALDDSGLVPDNFISDTGVYVGITNGSPNSQNGSDPCRAGGFADPIQATLVKGSVKFVYGGNSATIDLDDLRAPDGRYFGSVGWEVSLGFLAVHFPNIILEQPSITLNEKK